MRGSREVLEEVHRLGYGVSGPIARGAFLLERISDGRPAVLRVLPWNYGWSERFTAHVAPAWRRVAEPRVVRLLAVGPQASGFLIREHVDGIDLRALLRRGPLPAALGAHVATQLCAALTALHREAGPHLRLWPGHVLISSEGSVKLIGLEDRHEERRFEASGPVGPPDALAYCCPEEIMSARVDARGDVFSLGILVFEALVGQPLFGGVICRKAKHRKTLIDNRHRPMQHFCRGIGFTVNLAGLFQFQSCLASNCPRRPPPKGEKRIMV